MKKIGKKSKNWIFKNWEMILFLNFNSKIQEELLFLSYFGNLEVN